MNNLWSSTNRKFLAAQAIFVLLSGCSGLGLVGKVSLMRVMFHLPSAVLVAFCLVVIGLPAFWQTSLRFRSFVAPAFAVVLVLACLVLYPRMSRLHGAGHGSDQAACVIAAAGRLGTLRWPYDTNLMWSHNPMSCGAGWVLLQTPFILSVGYGVAQVLLLAICFAVIWRSAGKELAVSLAALLALSPGVWLCAVDGSDFLLFGVAIAAILATAKYTRVFQRFALPSIALAALVYQFRPPFVVMPAGLREEIGVRRATAIAGVALAMQALFFVWDPYDYVHSGPLHLIRKAVSNPAFVSRPRLVIAITTLILLITFALLLRMSKAMESTSASLAYMVLYLGVPSIVDLFRKLHESTSLRALGSWEGGPWLAACVPVAGLLLLSTRATAVAALDEATGLSESDAGRYATGQAA